MSKKKKGKRITKQLKRIRKNGKEDTNITTRIEK